jgi:hypothetical protein
MTGSYLDRPFYQEFGMLTPRHRALFEASLSALLLPSGSYPEAHTVTDRESKNLSDKRLKTGPDGSDAVAPPDTVKGVL